jgi:hypothetical protein
VSSTAPASPLRRRVVVVAASTLAVGTLSAIAPTPAIVTASAATTSAVTTAGLVAGTGTVSAVGASVTAPTVRTAPSAARTVATTRVGMVAPFRFGTVAYNQWWAKRLMATRYHWQSTRQFRCLVKLWNFESHWNHRAHNRRSGAHGIPQALPGSKMRSAGPDWRTNPVTQISWGLRYIKKRYSTPCGALTSFYRRGWY